MFFSIFIKSNFLAGVSNQFHCCSCLQLTAERPCGIAGAMQFASTASTSYHCRTEARALQCLGYAIGNRVWEQPTGLDFCPSLLILTPNYTYRSFNHMTPSAAFAAVFSSLAVELSSSLPLFPVHSVLPIKLLQFKEALVCWKVSFSLCHPLCLRDKYKEQLQDVTAQSPLCSSGLKEVMPSCTPYPPSSMLVSYFQLIPTTWAELPHLFITVHTFGPLLLSCTEPPQCFCFKFCRSSGHFSAWYSLTKVLVRDAGSDAGFGRRLSCPE